MPIYKIIKKLGELLRRDRAQHINTLITFNQTYLTVVKKLKDGQLVLFKLALFPIHQGILMLHTYSEV